MNLQPLEHRVPPPVVALLCALLAWGLDRAVPEARLGLPHNLPLAVGLATALLGVALDAWALWTFRGHRTTPSPLAPQRTRLVVQAGPYALSRNPMYLGLALQLLGAAIWLGNPLALVAPVLFVAWVTRWQIWPEERVLREKFGPDYERYCARVRRWL